MRILATLLAWLITTAMLAVAVPIAWVQLNLVDDNGFAALSQRAAHNPALQAAVAGELANQAVWLIRERGLAVDYSQVRDITAAYTAGPAFPPRFARAMQGAHHSMFADDGSGEWVIDLSAMLGDTAFRSAQSTATDYDVSEPLAPPLAVSAPESLPAGPLHALAGWGRWVSLGAAVLTGVGALLTLLAARRRGRALTGLGVSALLAGAIGWAGVEVVRRYLNDAFSATLNEAAVHRIADAMVVTGVAGLHQWLNLTLAAGGVLVAVGVIVATLGGLRKS